MNFDYQKLLQGSAMVFFQNGEDLVTPEFRQSIIDVMVLLKANDGQRLYQKLSHQMDEVQWKAGLNSRIFFMCNQMASLQNKITLV